MREIFILDGPDAGLLFLEEHGGGEATPEAFLGVGAFSTMALPSQAGRGLSITTVPADYSGMLSDEILTGHFSPFEKEILVLQGKTVLHPLLSSPGSFPYISRWLFSGQHTSIFHPQVADEDVERLLPVPALKCVSTPEEFVQVFMAPLFFKIQEIRPLCVFFLFDVDIFCNYLNAFFQRYLNCHDSQWKNEDELVGKVVRELVWYIADSVLHPCVALLPSTQAAFNIMIEHVRFLKTRTLVSEDIRFRI